MAGLPQTVRADGRTYFKVSKEDWDNAPGHNRYVHPDDPMSCYLHFETPEEQGDTIIKRLDRIIELLEQVIGGSCVDVRVSNPDDFPTVPTDGHGRLL